MGLLLQTVKSVLDSHVVVVDKDEEVVGLLRVEPLCSKAVLLPVNFFKLYP